jgi:hypothetical protein
MSESAMLELRTHEVSPESNSTSTRDSRTHHPIPATYAKDDMELWNPSSRYVDYLSEDWQEEDIWLSWKHIVSKRTIYDNSARLENASWRAWAKSKYRLKTMLPEALNW